MKEYTFNAGARRMIRDLRVGECAVRPDGKWFIRTDGRQASRGCLARLDPGSANRPARNMATGEVVVLK